MHTYASELEYDKKDKRRIFENTIKWIYRTQKKTEQKGAK